MAFQEKVSEKVQTAIFAQLLNNPNNAECADCHTASPNWVSLDFGVFICMRCSGVHRQIGPHITRVRSIKLDGWTKDNIEIMATVGNKVANDYYEHRMPTGYRRPGTNSSADECRRFIDDKYIKKSFAPSGYQEPVKEFVACRTKGSKPDFSYSQKDQNKQQEAPKPMVEPEQQASHGLKFVRKKSASLDKFADHHHHEKKPAQPVHHPDLLSPVEVDLLGNYSEPNELHETHSASPPKKINFANFKKAQSQPAIPHLQNQQGHPTHNLGWSQEGSQLANDSSANQPQPQDNKVDLMKLYSQPQGHQNHFMQGMPHGWQYNNNGWNSQGYNTGYMGHQNHFQGGFPQNYGGQPGGHGNPNMGYNPYVNYGGAHMGTGQGPVQNQIGNNGFVQAPGPNKFF